MNVFIKNLSPDRQVGLLFILIFGLLLLATIFNALRTMRAMPLIKHRQRLDPDWHEQVQPFSVLLKSSWFLVVIFWLSWSMGAKSATILFAVLSFFALREFMTLSPTKHSDHRSLLLTFFFGIAYAIRFTDDGAF